MHENVNLADVFNFVNMFQPSDKKKKEKIRLPARAHKRNFKNAVESFKVTLDRFINGERRFEIPRMFPFTKLKASFLQNQNYAWISFSLRDLLRF